MKKPIALPLIVFFAARIPILLGTTFEGLRGYSDLIHFYYLAELPGFPFLQHWVEYPPAFSFLNKLVYIMAGGVEHVFTYLMVLILLAANAATVVLFVKIDNFLNPEENGPSWRSIFYAALTAGLPYSWWYNDSLVVFFLVLGLYLVLFNSKSWLAGLAISAGILLKIFPVLLLPALVRALPARRSAVISGTALGVFLVPVLILYWLSPTFTSASLSSQLSKGSSETIWALLDGNYGTRNLGPLVERLDPTAAYLTTRNPAVIPPLLTLLVIGGAGLYFFLRARLETPRKMIAFYGLTAVLFFLWSTSWSPQWLLYLLPAMLLVLPRPQGLLTSAVLVLLNLLEWPLLLSRGLISLLAVPIILRFIVFLMLAFLFYQAVRDPDGVPVGQE